MTDPDAKVRGVEPRGTLGDELDCGDNSRYFAPKSGGMRTNGGCRCFKNAGFPRSPTAAAFKLLPALRCALKERDEARERAERAETELKLRTAPPGTCSHGIPHTEQAPDCVDCSRLFKQLEDLLADAEAERDEARRERDAALKQLRERNENLDVRLRQVDSLRAQLEVAREGLSSAIDWLGKHQKPLSLNEVKQCLDHEKRCKEALAKLEGK